MRSLPRALLPLCCGPSRFLVRHFSLSISLVFAGSVWILPAPVSAAEPVVELDMVHELGPDKGEQLVKLVDRFNATNKGIHITVSSRPWTQGKPDLMILGSDSEALLLSRRSIKPLHEIMTAAEQTVRTLAVPRMMSPSSLDSKGRSMALPVGLGTPVMYANKQGLVLAGVDPDKLPKTWQDWQDIMGKLRQYGFNCPYTTSEPVSIFIENVSAWHNQPYMSAGKNSQISINGLMQVKHVAFMNSWVRGQYLHLFGQGNEAENQFAKGNCLTLTAPSSALPTLRRQAQFDIVVAPFPYHDGAYGSPQNTLADGPSMWVAAGRTAAEYKAVARFVSFWLTPESQVEWQVNAGYLPLDPAGLLVATDSALLQDQLIANRIGIAELTHKPVTNASAASDLAHAPGVRRVIGEELDAVWADRKPAKQALDDAVARIRSGRM
ncbi:MAG: glycerol-3-phosphate transporter substrate-binding protein [Rhodocyclales bacterium]|nr:glycerol-3-phosphate transporter substrate-binding protein [Rhodocyclales bacterium]